MSKDAPPCFSDGRKFPLISIPKPADRGVTNSNINDRAPPKSTSKRIRIRRRNPFSDGRRNNFPDLDNFFKSTSESPSPGRLRVGHDSFHSHSRHDAYDDEDECYHLSDVGETSVLNMSIGARAALNEHARHVAKYGIDGEVAEKQESDESENQKNNSYEISSNAGTNVFLDHQWERLFDLSQVNYSSEGSDSGGIPPTPNFGTINSKFDVVNASTDRSGYEESSIEVLTDVSYDYFNSSRINLLVTPERNKNFRTAMIVTRDGNGVEDDLFGNHQNFLFDGAEADGLPYHDEIETSRVGSCRFTHSSQEGAFVQDPWVSSFNIGDVSRISAHSVSNANCTPNTSFQNYHSHGKKGNKSNDNFNGPLSAHFGADSPSMILNDSSFSSIGGMGPSQLPFDNNGYTSPEIPFSPSNDQKSGIRTKEKPSPDRSANSSSSIQSTVSSFIAEARTMAKQVVSDVEKSIGAMESLPVDFLRALEIGRADTLSPISRALSTPPSSRRDGSKKEKSQSKIHDTSKVNSSNSTSNNISSLSSSLSVIEDAAQTHLTGRKRYRTVVPRRVYLDSIAQQCDEEQDSFYVVQSDPETSRTGKRLLESFEEATTLNTF
ncbi:unnamed protein product [Pseudo-nitzschia multistriata]|uniref:Uncharacterized protein n=1 Tax=Pseudo-nitzschia multistriata TaxID=183589 RepID=A0A448ZF31_9STRA|nr:unnamed protein product [Pseudo-nitzschia multistriata]